LEATSEVIFKSFLSTIWKVCPAATTQLLDSRYPVQVNFNRSRRVFNLRLGGFTAIGRPNGADYFLRHTQRVFIRIVSSGKSSQLLKLEPSVHTVCMRGDKPKPEKKKKKAKK